MCSGVNAVAQQAYTRARCSQVCRASRHDRAAVGPADPASPTSQKHRSRHFWQRCEPCCRPDSCRLCEQAGSAPRCHALKDQQRQVNVPPSGMPAQLCPGVPVQNPCRSLRQPPCSSATQAWTHLPQARLSVCAAHIQPHGALPAASHAAWSRWAPSVHVDHACSPAECAGIPGLPYTVPQQRLSHTTPLPTSAWPPRRWLIFMPSMALSAVQKSITSAGFCCP